MVTEFSISRKLICDFLLVINSNLALYYHAPFPRYSVRQVQNRYIRLPLLCLTPPTAGFPWEDFRKIFIERSQIAKIPNGVETLQKISIA